MRTLSAKEIRYGKDHFIESVTEKLALLFPSYPPSEESSIQAGRRGMFICSKLRQNLSEIEVRPFIRIKRVTWDHLLAFKGEIIQKQVQAAQALFLKHTRHTIWRIQ